MNKKLVNWELITKYFIKIYLFNNINRGGYKDSVGGGKNFQFSARSAPKFFLPPLEIFLPPPRKIS